VIEARGEILLTIVYFIVAIILLFGMFKTKYERPTVVATLLLPILTIPLIFLKPILLIPLIVLWVINIMYQNKYIYFFVFFIFILIYSVLGSFNLIFSGFVEITDIEVIPSPNGSYNLILREIDQGALGGDVAVLIESKSFLGIIKRNRQTLSFGYWGYRPELSWVDNDTVEINGKQFNIFNNEE